MSTARLATIRGWVTAGHGRQAPCFFPTEDGVALYRARPPAPVAGTRRCDRSLAQAQPEDGVAELQDAKGEIIRELKDEMRRGNGVTRWMVGITASLAGGALATNVAILIYLVLMHP